MHTEEFSQALYNLIDMKVIDYRDEYQMLLEYFTTTEELNAYLETREDVYKSLGVSWHIGGTCDRLTVLWIWQCFMGVSVALWGA